MLQVYVNVVRELCGRFGDACPLHVRHRGLRFLHVGAQ